MNQFRRTEVYKTEFYFTIKETTQREDTKLYKITTKRRDTD